jgi:hypothetical protein
VRHDQGCLLVAGGTSRRRRDNFGKPKRIEAGGVMMPNTATKWPAGDQVIRENPASRGAETSAGELVGPPWRMVSNAGQQQWCGG